jgi:hypothetical protein
MLAGCLIYSGPFSEKYPTLSRNCFSTIGPVKLNRLPAPLNQIEKFPFGLAFRAFPECADRGLARWHWAIGLRGSVPPAGYFKARPPYGSLHLQIVFAAAGTAIALRPRRTSCILYKRPCPESLLPFAFPRYPCFPRRCQLPC